jgi:hypothetical protein
MGRGRIVAEGTPEELKRATGKTSLEDVFVTYQGGRAGASDSARERAHA